MGDKKVKHGLTFIYEPPKGFDKSQGDKTLGDDDFKLEWKRDTPRETDVALDERDIAGGALEEEVICLKCGEPGHLPTDKKVGKGLEFVWVLSFELRINFAFEYQVTLFGEHPAS